MTNQETIANLNMISVAFVEPVTKEQRKLIDDTFEMAIKALEQEPKTGHWIEHPHECGENWEYPKYECSECSEWEENDSEYCPNCGAKMIEPQERSDKE